MATPQLPPVIRRTAAQLASWIVPKNALVQNTDTSQLVVGDGSTTGGVVPAATVPDSTYASLDTSLGTVVLQDAAGNIAWTDGDIQSTLAEHQATLMSAQPSYQFTTLDTLPSFVIVDLLGQILWQGSDTTGLALDLYAARGDTPTLATRLSRGLTPYGDPIGATYGLSNLRQTHMQLRQLALGRTAQLIWVMIGDSYTQISTIYSADLAKTLQTEFGFAGLGWIGFSWAGTASGTWTSGSQPIEVDGSIRPDLCTYKVIGTWTATYNVGSTNAPSISWIKSSTADDYVTWTFPEGHTAANLFYAGDGTGVVQVSWDDGGTWSSSINLTSTTATHVALPAPPNTAATARIKVISGNVTLCGVDMQSDAAGIRIHRLAGFGSRTQQWAAVDPTTWSAHIDALNPQLLSVLHGTNDQSSGYSPATAVGYLGTIVNNVLSVRPQVDVWIQSPTENNKTTNAIPMPRYAQAQREYAVANGFAYSDDQYVFGSPANNGAAYSHSNPWQPWMQSDNVHPNTLGGAAMTDFRYRFLTTY